MGFWKELTPGAKLRFGVGAVLILVLTAWLGMRVMRTEYDVLFTQLSEGDAASIVEQLRKLKVPYELADEGATVQVPAGLVHETRLRLMSGGVPLAGGVGFEIFDKQGLGATEQSQRVSYQRALQGELARTIGALEDVKQARVHLVLPESTLFKRDRQEARAAVTLTVKPGSTLSHEQVMGIQRLVSASVAGLDSGRVVVTDQRGITLSGANAAGEDGVPTEARLEMKRGIEEYVTRKVARLLDSTYGPGQAIVSVDVALNFDEIRRTVQDAQPSGVKRRRQVVAGASRSDSTEDPLLQESAAQTPSNSSTDVEYEYGRRVEQVIAAPGGITRLSIGVIVPGALSAEKQERMTALVRMAAGVNEQRGDAIVVQALDQVSGREALSGDEPVEAAPAEIEPPAAPIQAAQAAPDARQLVSWGFGALALLIVAVLLMATRMRSRKQAPASLSTNERQALLLEIQRALEDDVPVSGTRAGK
jgi:flagellar M-ring protein FliF